MICTQSYSSTAAKLFAFFEGERGRQPVPLEGRQFDTGCVARVFFSSALFIAVGITHQVQSKTSLRSRLLRFEDTKAYIDRPLPSSAHNISAKNIV